MYECDTIIKFLLIVLDTEYSFKNNIKTQTFLIK